MGKIITGALLSLAGLLLIILRMRLVYAIVGKIKTRIGLMLNVDRLEGFISAIQVFGILFIILGLVFIVRGIIKLKN